MHEMMSIVSPGEWRVCSYPIIFIFRRKRVHGSLDLHEAKPPRIMMCRISKMMVSADKSLTEVLSLEMIEWCYTSLGW